VGKSVAESGIKETTGVTLVGYWDHGKLVPVTPDYQIRELSIFILGGTRDQIEAYNAAFGHQGSKKSGVVIIGGSRVGCATAMALDEQGVEWRMVEKMRSRVRFPERTIVGDASEFDLLVRAGLHEASTVIITTHDDDTNLFLTIFYRRLRKNLQIISRCTREDNVARLHRAGADVVLSYATMSANTILNYLRGSETLVLAEGVSIFSAKTPSSLEGATLAKSQVRSLTGCSIIAMDLDGKRTINPDPDTVMQKGRTLILIASLEAEEKFHKIYGS
jgi:Trk K+ transport system NAD-binding subunit